MVKKEVSEFIAKCSDSLDMETVYPVVIGPIILGQVRLVERYIKGESAQYPTGFEARLISNEQPFEIKIKIGEAIE